ncbi:molecular chaperone-like protein [Methylobacterium sp. J-078]|uniref:molecular chaperone-like protein n=1 Tax=Methylobacterium sp. J-078 TaxID=2836657 RepID=UPI001FBB6287|nr:molecular chaperone-like protein [Methylobacterium sp. J-078]MCJ2043930.1 molecular chaperone-like protein [Methylobacterium sp. J-078]
MTVPRWIPFLAIALILAAAITVGLLWSRGAMRASRDDARGSGAPAACAPLNPTVPPPPDCPQARSPTQRAP